MTTLEQFSLFQRMTGSIKADIEAGKNIQALGKIELLEGELRIMRQEYEPREESIESTESGTTPTSLLDSLVNNRCEDD